MDNPSLGPVIDRAELFSEVTMHPSLSTNGITPPLGDDRIRQLNDALRVHGSGGRLMFSAGIAVMSQDEILAIRCAVAGFSAFSPDNDPYGQHDCAILEVGPNRILWKIDYFDADYAGHSPDPADPKQTQRVLTLMLAEEY